MQETYNSEADLKPNCFVVARKPQLVDIAVLLDLRGRSEFTLTELLWSYLYLYYLPIKR